MPSTSPWPSTLAVPAASGADRRGALRLRIASAAVLVPVLVGAMLAGTPWLLALIALIAVLAAWEMVGLLRGAGLASEPIVAIGLTLATVAGMALADRGAFPVVMVAGATMASAVVAFARRDPADGFRTWIATLFGALYVGLLGFLVAILLGAPALRAGSPVAGYLDAGRAWLLVVVLGVWSFDTAAFVVGRAWGRGRFLAHISPAKTWSGVVGGTLGVIAVSTACLAVLTDQPAWGIVLGALIAAAAQAGDVAESMLKRAAGAKDSGTLIPGHGGILDRIDSFLFAAPAVYAFLQVAGPSL